MISVCVSSKERLAKSIPSREQCSPVSGAGQVADVIFTVVELSQRFLLSIVPQLIVWYLDVFPGKVRMFRFTYLHITIVVARSQHTVIHDAQTVDRRAEVKKTKKVRSTNRS